MSGSYWNIHQFIGYEAPFGFGLRSLARVGGNRSRVVDVTGASQKLKVIINPYAPRMVYLPTFG